MNEPQNRLHIVEVLRACRANGMLEDFGSKLEQTTKSVLDSPDPKAVGIVTLTIKVNKFSGSQVIISDAIKVVEPRQITEPTTFYVNEDGELSRKDPRQLSLLDQAGTK